MSWRLDLQKVTFSMSKRKACYDVSYKLKAVKCAEDKSKEAAARMFKVIHVGFASGASRRRNCMFPGSLRTGSSSPKTGVHVALYIWCPLTTLSLLVLHTRPPPLNIVINSGFVYPPISYNCRVRCMSKGNKRPGDNSRQYGTYFHPFCHLIAIHLSCQVS